MEKKITYFEDAGGSHTAEVLSLAKARADELGIKDVVVASTVGDTAVSAVDVFKGFNVVVVGLAVRMWKPNASSFSEEKRKIVESKGGRVLLTVPAFSGVGGPATEQFHSHHAGEIIANTLRVFGQGMKVACEIVLEAANGGYVRSDEPVISLAGTGKFMGADTAIVVSPVNSHRFFSLKVHEIICKPRM